MPCVVGLLVILGSDTCVLTCIPRRQKNWSLGLIIRRVFCNFPFFVVFDLLVDFIDVFWSFGMIWFENGFWRQFRWLQSLALLWFSSYFPGFWNSFRNFIHYNMLNEMYVCLFRIYSSIIMLAFLYYSSNFILIDMIQVIICPYPCPSGTHSVIYFW